MPFIKSVLKEELKNSLAMRKGYEKALKKLPIGSLRAKKIRGKIYYYRAQRENGKFKDVYVGVLSAKEVKGHKAAQSMRAKYKRLLSQVNKQIKFINGAIRGKEAI